MSIVQSSTGAHGPRIIEGESYESAQGVKWDAEWEVRKYWGPSSAVLDGTVEPYEIIRKRGNLLLLGGADLLWLGLITSTRISATTGLKHTVFDNANAAILVGDSNTAAANTQTGLQASSASTDQDAAPMDATYPLHTTGTGTTGCRDVTFRGTFTTAQANFAWNEWGVGNSTQTTDPYKGRLLNRKVETLGTKTSAATWTFQVKLSLS